jgi:indole-3-glycerol phosphate synthase
VSVPVLRKDFHVDPVQVWDARALGASALLLIVRALGRDGLSRMGDVAREAEIDALVEVHDEWELEWAVESGAGLIGVNQRNLETLVMDADVPGRVLPRIPGSCVAVAESGVATRDDVVALSELGADAILVGSALSTAADPIEAVRALVRVPRRAHRG